MASLNPVSFLLPATTGVAPLVLVAAILLYAAYSVLQYARLRAFKGPASAAWSRLWLLDCVQSGRMHHIFYEVSTKYGM